VARGGNDEFNYRSAIEAAGTNITGAGSFTLNTNDVSKLTTGSQWTDISISDTYHTGGGGTPGPNFDTTQPNPPNGGVAGDFPDATVAVPNNPFFRFSFYVDKADIIEDSPLYLTVKFADYDVPPVTVNLTGISGALTPGLIQLTAVNPATQDGYIEMASSDQIPFDGVFISDGTRWRGLLEVQIQAGSPGNYEPFFAIDFVQLGVTAIPEPSAAWTAVGLAIAAVAARKRRRR
jgi:hypothetical protein